MHLSHRFHFLLRLKGSCFSFIFQGWLRFGHELGLILESYSILVAIILTVCGWFEFLGSRWYTTSVGSQLQFFLFCSILVPDSLDFTLQYSTSSVKWLVLCPFFFILSHIPYDMTRSKQRVKGSASGCSSHRKSICFLFGASLSYHLC